MADDKVTAKKQVATKLHPEYDADIIEEISKIPLRERSHVFRQALREYFQKRKDGENK